MPLELRFTPAALAELDDAISYVAARIGDVAARLTDQPRSGG